MTLTRTFLATLLVAVFAATLTVSGRQDDSPVEALEVPDGFEIAVFAEDVENARTMVLGPEGTLFVGSRTADKLHAVVDRNGDHRADEVILLSDDLDQPNGLAIRDGALYVA